MGEIKKIFNELKEKYILSISFDDYIKKDNTYTWEFFNKKDDIYNFLSITKFENKYKIKVVNQWYDYSENCFLTNINKNFEINKEE